MDKPLNEHIFVDKENGWYVPSWRDDNKKVHHLIPDGFRLETDAKMWIADKLGQLVVVEVNGGVAEVVCEGNQTIPLIIDYDNH